MKDFHRWRPHPWHGLETGPQVPEIVNAYIEITPFDLVKYEIDKITGYLHVDRPQRSSAQPPSLYGFIPRTYCAERVRALAPGSTRGDGDPLDICVLSERPITKSEVILRARVVGGLQMLDNGEADDKVIAVLLDDPVWHDARDIDQIPPALAERLEHYFSTYKLIGSETPRVQIQQRYGRDHAFRVIEAAIADYREEFETES